MDTLYDISGYFDETNNYNFNEVPNWHGQIILKEQGYFEGIVIESDDLLAEKNLIYGFCFPNTAIQLTKISFHGHELFGGNFFKTNEGYEGVPIIGDVKQIGVFKKGSAKIVLEEVRERDINTEKSVLQEKIRLLTHANRSSGYISFYKETSSLRDEMAREIFEHLKSGRMQLETKTKKLN